MTFNHGVEGSSPSALTKTSLFINAIPEWSFALRRNESVLDDLNTGSVPLEFRYASDWLGALHRPEWRRSVYLVLDDLGRHDRVWRETDAETAELETVILDLLEGQYKSPVRVVSFNTAEKWSQDVSADVAHELRRRCDLQLRDVPSSIQDFVERHEDSQRQLTLSLAR